MDLTSLRLQRVRDLCRSDVAWPVPAEALTLQDAYAAGLRDMCAAVLAISGADQPALTAADAVRTRKRLRAWWKGAA